MLVGDSDRAAAVGCRAACGWRRSACGRSPIWRIAPRGSRRPGSRIWRDRSHRRARPAGRRVQRPGRAPAGGAADAAAVHGGCVARTADAGVGGAYGGGGDAQPRASRRSRVPRGADDRRRPGGATRASRRGHARAGACRCRRIHAAAGRPVSRRSSSPSAGAPWKCSPPNAASRSSADTPGEMPFRGDEELLRRLVVNVLQNAVQHTPTGGVVRVSMARRYGRISAIRVTDDGAGSSGRRPAAHLRSLRPARSRRAGRAGAGLGLPIARWIAEAHGGRLGSERSTSSGSTFCLSLPI